MKKSFIILACTLMISIPNYGNAQSTLCVRKRVKVKNGAIQLGRALRLVEGPCPNQFSTLLDATEFAGPTGEKGEKGDTGEPGRDGVDGAEGPVGPAGDDGADGSDANLRSLVYGDGSAGELTVSGFVNLSDITGVNQNFTTIHVQPGADLFVPAGTTLRCTDSFINEGTIWVFDERGRYFSESPTMATLDIFRPHPLPNVYGAIAGLGEFGDATATLKGGNTGGGAMSSSVARGLLNPPFNSCGKGAPGRGFNGQCGGTLRIICDGPIENRSSGTILAGGNNGTNGAGGGSGGFVIIGSSESVDNSGTVRASGGFGGNSGPTNGAGGGGGGGVVHFLAPEVSNTGSVDVSGGDAGPNSNAVTTSPRTAGGAGGSLGGRGGSGGDVTSSDVAQPAQAGTDGLTIETTEDPTILFLQQQNYSVSNTISNV